MFRHRVRPPSPPLDEITAERLLRGAPIDDLPDAFRPLGQLLADVNGPATAEELRGSAAAAAAFVAAHHAANAPRRRMRTMTASVLAVLTLAATTGTAVAATQGSLPMPVQQIAHDALGVVGISVPGTEHTDTRNDGRDGPTSVNSGTNGTAATTPPASTPKSTGAGVVPATPAAGATTSDPVTGSENAGGNGNGTPQGGQGVAGENPNAGPGNSSGNGNPDPGQGSTGGDPVDAPSNHLPPQSNGNGNGPPQVPPGQAKND